MILYEVKLICLETNKVIFSSLNAKPLLPPHDLMKKEPKPMLIINTRDSNAQEIKKKSA
jgi:hypothetical protein